jgi:hypothetical protein
MLIHDLSLSKDIIIRKDMGYAKGIRHMKVQGKKRRKKKGKRKLAHVLRKKKRRDSP